jgi:hypothetical protein
MHTHPVSALLACASFALLAGLPATSLAAADAYPQGCVSCHVVDKATGTDQRISTLLEAWTAGKVSPELIALSKAAMPAGVTLKGKHPAAADSLEDIPNGCLDCHEAGSKKAPPFALLMHTVHLTGAKNDFVMHHKSDCTSCHKLNAKTGEWTLPSAAEK